MGTKREVEEIQKLGLTLPEAKFAELVASGMNKTEAYRRCYPASSAHRESLYVMASKLSQRVAVATRIEYLRNPQLQPKGERDVRLLDAGWLRLEVLQGLYNIASQGDSERVRLEAWKLLAQTRDVNLISSGSVGTTVNVQANQIAGATPASDADVLRLDLVREMRALLPERSADYQSDDCIELGLITEGVTDTDA